MRVDRCVCLNLSLEQLKSVADECGADFEELRRRTGCCSSCGLCEPYIRLMLETGKTRFALLRQHEIDELMARVHGAAQPAMGADDSRRQHR